MILHPETAMESPSVGSGAKQVLLLGEIKSEINLPRARVRLVRYVGQRYDVEGVLEGYRLSMALRRMAGAGTIRFPGHPRSPSFETTGDMFLLPPNLPIRSHGESGTHYSIVCEFAPDAFRQWFDRDIDWLGGDVGTVLNIDSDLIRGSLRRLADELVNPGFAHEMACELLTAQTGLDLARHCLLTIDRQWVGGLSPRRLRLIDERLESCEVPPTLAELADLCGISVRQLTRGFRTSRTCSIGDYLARRRMDRAQQLLESGIGIKEIAHRLGFASPGNFSTAFRRATGVSPRQFRSTMRSYAN